MKYFTESIDADLHRAIDMLQALVFRLEALKNRSELLESELDNELEGLTRYAVDCANLLHDARKDVYNLSQV